MNKIDDCVFCKIAAKELPAYVIWEDEKHVAFLSRHPNTEGFSVVITKEHNPSYLFELDDATVTELVLAAKKVGLLIDEKYEDVGRTGMIFEGFGVNHIHAKLFPMHGTAEEEWKQRGADITKYFDVYEGYISSHDAGQADEDELQRIADKIRN